MNSYIFIIIFIIIFFFNYTNINILVDHLQTHIDIDTKKSAILTDNTFQNSLPPLN